MVARPHAFGQNIMAVGMCAGGAPLPYGRQEAEKGNTGMSHGSPSGHAPRDPLPPTRPHLLPFATP
jgi:hypothetical protein